MSLLSRLFISPPDPREDLRPLWRRVVELSRDPALYREDGVADTVAGRFDMIAAFLAMVMLRLEREDLAQENVWLTELFVADMDAQLRETGLGDVVVGKHIGRLVSVLGGRLGALRDALASPDGALLEAALARNVTMADKRGTDALARRLRGFADKLAGLGDDEVLAGELRAVSAPEFSRPFDARQITAKPIALEATKEERQALTRRFALVTIKNLKATVRLQRDGEAVVARGRLSAAIVQSCAISGEDLSVAVEEPLALRFVPAGQTEAEEIELDAQDLDEIPFDGDSFDLGEAVAQSLALAIDPYATGPEAERVRKEAGLGDEAASGPFAALAALKKP